MIPTHARWAIKALLECASKQNILIESVSDYYSFFEKLTSRCPKDNYTHISWECTPDTTRICNDIKACWDDIKQQVLAQDDNVTTVQMEHFVLEERVLKGGKDVKRLKAVSTLANLTFITDFISNLLPKIINH